MAGCAFYAWYDAQFDAEGYAWAGLYWLAMVVSMLYVKHSFNVHKVRDLVHVSLVHPGHVSLVRSSRPRVTRAFAQLYVRCEIQTTS